jgi:hypothetical protein
MVRFSKEFLIAPLCCAGRPSLPRRPYRRPRVLGLRQVTLANGRTYRARADRRECRGSQPPSSHLRDQAIIYRRGVGDQARSMPRHSPESRSWAGPIHIAQKCRHEQTRGASDSPYPDPTSGLKPGRCAAQPRWRDSCFGIRLVSLALVRNRARSWTRKAAGEFLPSP